VAAPAQNAPKVKLAPALVLALALLAGLAAFGAWQWQRNGGQKRQQAVERETAAVVRQDITVKVSATGVIRPVAPVNISPKQPGRIQQLLVEQGDRVAAGQLLAQMDASNLQGQRTSAMGDLAAAEANLSKLVAGNRPEEIAQARNGANDARAQLVAIRSAYTSNQKLYEAGAVGRVAFDASAAQYRAAQEKVQATQSQLELLQAGFRKEDIALARAQVLKAKGSLQTINSLIEDTLIRAPFAGVITQKFADVGAFVTPTTSASATSSATSSSIVALAGALEGLANVSEVDIGSINAGQAVELLVDAYPRRPVPARVRLIAPESVVVQNVTSFQVRLSLPKEGDPKLMSGMNFTANFLVGRHDNALLVPTSAIVSQEGGTGVLLHQAGGKPRFQPVRVGATVGSQTDVKSGIKEGQRVYISFPGQRKPNNKPVRSGSPFQPAGGGRGIR
jgi:HlyD family secretion protein